MNSEPVRVLSIVEGATASGLARQAIEFAELARPAVEVTLATYYRGAGDHPIVAAAKQRGIPAITIPERGRFDRGVVSRLRELLAEVRPHLLETNNTKSHFLVRAAGFDRERPWIAFTHGYTATDLIDRAYSQLDRWSLRGAHRVVAVCRPFAALHQSRGIPAARIRVLHSHVHPAPPVPESEVSRVRGELGLGGLPVILSVGRLSAEKGHADLLRAVYRLRRLPGTPEFRVVIAGDGAERPRLEAQRRELGLERDVILAGFRSDTSALYAAATVLALPSHSEGSPIALLEAMSAGVPAAATSVGGVPEVVEHERTALLVPARDPEAMAAALHRMLNAPDLRRELAGAARVRALQVFSPERRTRDLVAFYAEVLAEQA